MAEAIGVASSVLAFACAAIGTATAIVNVINGIKDAPDSINELRQDLQIVKGMLEHLTNSESSGKPTETTRDEITKELVKQCQTVLKGIEVELAPLSDKLKGGKMKSSWGRVCIVVNEKSIKEHGTRLMNAKISLIFGMAVRAENAAAPAPKPVTEPAAESSSKPAGEIKEPPPTYTDAEFEKPKRRNTTEFIKAALRRKSTAKSSSGKNDAEPQDDTPKLPTFSQVVSSTMEDMTRSIGDGKGPGYNLSTFQMLWRSDLERIRALWDLNPETVQHLKRMINDHMCSVFLLSLAANPSTMNDINDAAEGTLEWIDKTDEFTRWQEPEESKFLLLEGKAGSGKSVFTKTLWKMASESIEKSEPKNAVVLSYFCNNRMRTTESCVDILRAWIYQYLRDDKSRFTEVYEKCKSLVDVWDPSQPSQFTFNMDNLLDIFATILNISEKKTVYCIVDAIDECQYDDDMEKFIARLPCLMKRDATLKLFISARPDWIADNNLSHVSPLKLVLRPEITGKDIAQVVELELCRVSTKLTIGEKEKLVLKKKLITKAEGMMLWVVLAFRRIQERIKAMLAPTLKWLEKMVDKLPREIFGLYDDIMKRIRKKYGPGRAHHHKPGDYTDSSDSEEDEESSNLAIYGKLVLWVARSARPLTVTELQYALAMDMNDTSFDEVKSKVNLDIERVIGRIPFLEIVAAEAAEDDFDACANDHNFWFPKQTMAPAQTVRFIHQSAKEYILQSAESSSREPKESEKDADFTYPKLDDACIGNICVSFLNMKDFAGGPVRKFEQGVRFREGFKQYLVDYGFLEYSALYWAYHLDRAPNLPDTVKANVARWICDHKDNIRLYQQVFNFVRFDERSDIIDGEFGIIAAAGSGIDWLTEFLIKEGHDLDARDEWGRTGYMLASWRGFQKTAQIMADAGANTDCSFSLRLPEGFHGGILDEGCEMKHIKQAIDEGGVNIDERDWFEQTPIFYACGRGDAEIVSLILDQNPDLSITDKYGRLPIDVALNPECRDLIIKKMREKKIKCSRDLHSKIPCVHPWQGQVLNPPCCNTCGRSLWTFFFHCCGCSSDEYTFEICQQCWEDGKRCLDNGHKLLRRVYANFLVSWLDYTPHLAKQKIESAIIWKDPPKQESVAETQANSANSPNDVITSGTNAVNSEDIRPAQAQKPQEPKPPNPMKVEGLKQKITVQEVEEKDAGCKCVIS